jgi:DNA (cytosine-5)-methyltransferase 1
MRHGSLFSGIGGFDLAAQWMGWENVFQVEKDGFCQRVLTKNYPEVKKYGDIKQFDGKKYKEQINILSGGFPCQDISYAKTWTTDGKFKTNGLMGERSGLWWQYHRIIDESRPPWVVAENVPALTNQGLGIVLQSLSDIGYDAEWAILPASWVGAPHLRKRIWIVAYPISLGRDEESIIFSQIIKQKIRQTPQWEFSRTVCKANGKKNLPESLGIYDVIPKGLHHAERIKSLGNAIVPQVAYQIFKAIEEFAISENEV